jgi:hypothetical protein
VPPAVRRTRAFQRAFRVASAGWLVGNLVRAVLRLWLVSLLHVGVLPLEVYLIVDTVAGWPINVSMVAFTVWYPLRELRRAGLMGRAEEAESESESVLEAIERAVKEVEVESPAPGTV